MSKVTDALDRAAAYRVRLSNGGSVYTLKPAEPLSVAPVPAVAPSPDGGSPTSGTPAGATVDQAAQGWEEAISRCQLKLSEAERGAAEQRRHQAGLLAQVAIYQDLSTQASSQLDALKRQQTEGVQQGEAIERARVTYERQLAALRECQTLSHTARLVQEELDACGHKMTESAQAQQRLADESARWASRREELRRRLDQLRQQVGQAMARFEAAVEPTSAGPNAS